MDMVHWTIFEIEINKIDIELDYWFWISKFILLCLSWLLSNNIISSWNQNWNWIRSMCRRVHISIRMSLCWICLLLFEYKMRHAFFFFISRSNLLFAREKKKAVVWFPCGIKNSLSSLIVCNDRSKKKHISSCVKNIYQVKQHILLYIFLRNYWRWCACHCRRCHIYSEFVYLFPMVHFSMSHFPVNTPIHFSNIFFFSILHSLSLALREKVTTKKTFILQQKINKCLENLSLRDKCVRLRCVR